MAGDRPGGTPGRGGRTLHGPGRRDDESGPRRYLGYLDGAPGRGSGRARLGRAGQGARLALAAGAGGLPLVSHHASLPPGTTRRVATRLRAHGPGGAAAHEGRGFMPMMAELLATGWRFHQAGDLSRAEQAYRQAVQQEPANAHGWYLLGVLCQARGDLAA